MNLEPEEGPDPDAEARARVGGWGGGLPSSGVRWVCLTLRVVSPNTIQKRGVQSLVA